MLHDLIGAGIHQVANGEPCRKTLKVDGHGLIPTSDIEVVDPLPARNDVADNELIREPVDIRRDDKSAKRRERDMEAVAASARYRSSLCEIVVKQRNFRVRWQGNQR